MICIENKPSFYIGVDTHQNTHTACIINYDTDKVLTFTFKNEPQYYPEALQKMLDVTKTKNIIFGLEDVHSFGLHFSQYLTHLEYVVKHVNPAYANAYRASLPNYHKSDNYDSFCVAKVLKDGYKQLPSFQYEQVFSSIRLLVSQRTIAAKQKATSYKILHQQVSKVYPGYAQFFSSIHIRGALAFFQRFPAPRHLKHYTKEKLTTEMKQYTRIFRESTAEKILHISRVNKLPYDDVIVEETIVEVVNDILAKEAKIERIEKQLEPLIAQTGYQLQTIPGVSIATAGMLISEIGNIARFPNEKQLARFSGISPTSIGSADKGFEQSSLGGNRRLRATFYFLAVGMIIVSKEDEARHPLFRDYFLRKLMEGKTKSQAITCIMRQLIRIVFSMMKNKSEFKIPEYVRQIPSEPLKATVLKKKH